jgi:hypothetical protein
MTMTAGIQNRDDPEEMGFYESALRYMRKREADWLRQGFSVTWVDPEPMWVSACDWDMFLEDPSAPGRRIYRLSLQGGGQISVVEIWAPINCGDGVDRWLSCYRPSLIVSAHTPDGLIRYRGTLESACSEMHAHAVKFRNVVPADVADRVAATLRAIDTTPDNFYALLDGSQGCAFCCHPLRDEVSKLVGVGPDCARKHNVPHSMAAASKRLEIRRKILGETEQIKH